MTVHWLVGHNFLQGREVSLPCFYRSIRYFFYHVQTHDRLMQPTLTLISFDQGTPCTKLHNYLFIYKESLRQDGQNQLIALCRVTRIQQSFGR